MTVSYQEKASVKDLYQCKERGSWMILTTFLEKNWKRERTGHFTEKQSGNRKFCGTCFTVRGTNEWKINARRQFCRRRY